MGRRTSDHRIRTIAKWYMTTDEQALNIVLDVVMETIPERFKEASEGEREAILLHHLTMISAGKYAQIKQDIMFDKINTYQRNFVDKK